jgi:hypothetical protein
VFVGDELFDLAPRWFREKAARHVTVVTDLARLVLILHHLDIGYERVIWCDADVLVYSPYQFRPSESLSFGFSREIWSACGRDGKLNGVRRINNSICLFRQEGRSRLVDFIDMSKSVVASVMDVSSNLIIGTSLLTWLDMHDALPIVHNTGLLSPFILRAIVNDDEATLRRFVKWHEEPLYAVNLCNAFRNKTVSDELFNDVTLKLSEHHGSALNKYWDETNNVDKAIKL